MQTNFFFFASNACFCKARGVWFLLFLAATRSHTLHNVFGSLTKLFLTVLKPLQKHKPFKSLREVVGQIIGRSLIDIRQVQLLREALPQQRRRPPARKPHAHTHSIRNTSGSVAQRNHVHVLPDKLRVTHLGTHGAAVIRKNK